MRVIWLTDLHLNFVPHRARKRFYERVRAAGTDAILVGGDVGEADSVAALLSEMEAAFGKPIYFVLGNHDFYHGSFASVRGEVAAVADASQHLTWLTTAGVVPLTETTALIGHDSWADGRLGDGVASDVLLNDFVLIDDLRLASKDALFDRLRALGDQAARESGQSLLAALRSFRHVIFMTHVPPFREACWHEGNISGADFLPHFTCKAMGDMLVERMAAFPECKLTVLCGHTHGEGVARIGENIVVRTGGAEYGRPEIQEILEL